MIRNGKAGQAVRRGIAERGVSEVVKRVDNYKGYKGFQLSCMAPVVRQPGDTMESAGCSWPLPLSSQHPKPWGLAFGPLVDSVAAPFARACFLWIAALPPAHIWLGLSLDHDSRREKGPLLQPVR